jgi:hypothetical protein
MEIIEDGPKVSEENVIRWVKYFHELPRPCVCLYMLESSTEIAFYSEAVLLIVT